MNLLNNDNNNGFILANGDLQSGFTFHGPFEDIMEASEYQNKYFGRFPNDCLTYPIEDKRKNEKHLTK